MYGFQSYISMPIIRRDGQFFGTLCAIDPLPARLTNPETIGMFRLFAELIAAHLDADERLILAEGELHSERIMSELREQFIAVLGHDLRNPVAAIEAGAKLLLRSSLDEPDRKIVSLMQGSVLRMRGLIDNVLDLARARLGGGLPLQLDAATPLQPVLEQVAAELQSVHPDRPIVLNFALTGSVACDHSRIAQLLSNLIGNALAYGTAGQPIRVEAATRLGHFELSVANAGEPIPAQTLERLFQPFFRGNALASQQGLGLGLYIASEIARMHQGTLTVSSINDETRFVFRMPVTGPVVPAGHDQGQERALVG